MEKETLNLLIKNGCSTRDISKKFNVSQSTVKYWLKKHNINTVYSSGVLSKKKYLHSIKNHVDFSESMCLCSCGETDPDKFYGKKKNVCAKCHNKYTLEVGRNKKLKAIEYLGGKCIICGYNKHSCALDFHHLDKNKKDINFKSKRGWSFERIKKELDGCVLLCSNCHREVHSGHVEINRHS